MYNLNSLSTTCSKFDSKPPGPWHDGMMKDMQECNLVVFLTQHKKYLKQIFNEQNVTGDNQAQHTYIKLYASVLVAHYYRFKNSSQLQSWEKGSWGSGYAD